MPNFFRLNSYISLLGCEKCVSRCDSSGSRRTWMTQGEPRWILIKFYWEVNEIVMLQGSTYWNTTPAVAG